MKKCSKCGVEKHTEDFPLNGGPKGQRRPDCRLCKGAYDKAHYQKRKVQAQAYNKQYRENNRPAVIASRRKYYASNRDLISVRGKEYRKRNADLVTAARRKSVYKLSPETFNEILVDQLGCCAICLLPMQKIHVDHNHKTGKVRGLLCGKCNCGIGQLKDSPDLLRAAALYLEQSA